MMKRKWTHDDISDQTGRIAIVTGANTGIDYETARALAHKGAGVTLACRSGEKGEAAGRGHERATQMTWARTATGLLDAARAAGLGRS